MTILRSIYQRLINTWESLEIKPDLSKMRLFISGSAPLSDRQFADFEDLTRAPAVIRPADLASHALLQSTWPERRDDWHAWLSAEGITDLAGFSFLYFESSALCYQAAIEGQGFAMAQFELIQDDLSAGRLVCPFESRLDQSDFTYYLIYPENRRLTTQMKAFRDWLMAECATFNRLPLRAAARPRRSRPSLRAAPGNRVPAARPDGTGGL